jgi:hypothetical protein
VGEPETPEVAEGCGSSRNNQAGARGENALWRGSGCIWQGEPVVFGRPERANCGPDWFHSTTKEEATP